MGNRPIYDEDIVEYKMEIFEDGKLDKVAYFSDRMTMLRTKRFQENIFKNKVKVYKAQINWEEQ